jgi:DNA-binding NarL/FixJ family response regulator
VWRLLLVDDRDSVREVLRLYADGRGLTVVGEAADGDTALAAAQRHRPHAIILDEEMPGRHGSDILPELRAELPDAVIVLYSSGRRAGVQDRARAMGADAYFDKRVSPREVIGAVIDILEAAGPAPRALPAQAAAASSHAGRHPRVATVRYPTGTRTRVRSLLVWVVRVLRTCKREQGG